MGAAGVERWSPLASLISTKGAPLSRPITRPPAASLRLKITAFGAREPGLIHADHVIAVFEETCSEAVPGMVTGRCPVRRRPVPMRESAVAAKFFEVLKLPEESTNAALFSAK